MYHISEEYRISNRRARYHYNRVRLLGLIPLGVALAFLWYAPEFYTPLLYGAIGAAAALHLMLWSSYEAHFGGKHTGWTKRKLEASDTWFPGHMILCQSGFFAVTLGVFWFFVCSLGFPASILDHLLLAAWLLGWSLQRVLRARLYVDPDNGTLETAHEFFRFSNIATMGFLIASLVTDFAGTGGDGNPNQDFLLVGMAVWLPAVLVAVGCVVMFLDHMIRKRPRRPRKDEFDVL